MAETFIYITLLSQLETNEWVSVLTNDPRNEPSSFGERRESKGLRMHRTFDDDSDILTGTGATDKFEVIPGKIKLQIYWSTSHGMVISRIERITVLPGHRVLVNVEFVRSRLWGWKIKFSDGGV